MRTVHEQKLIRNAATILRLSRGTNPTDEVLATRTAAARTLGSTTSEAKASAARINGSKGGRPRTKSVETAQVIEPTHVEQPAVVEIKDPELLKYLADLNERMMEAVSGPNQ